MMGLAKDVFFRIYMAIFGIYIKFLNCSDLAKVINHLVGGFNLFEKYVS